MSHLWTPWRMAYLRGENPLPKGCLFCVKPQLQDTEAHILHRGRLCYAILNRFPYNNGHLMIVPYVHVATLEDLDSETSAALMSYCLYTISERTSEVVGTTDLKYTIPFVMYGIFRYLYLIHKRGLGSDPSQLLLGDKPLLATVVLWAVVSGVILYLSSST